MTDMAFVPKTETAGSGSVLLLLFRKTANMQMAIILQCIAGLIRHCDLSQCSAQVM